MSRAEIVNVTPICPIAVTSLKIMIAASPPPTAYKGLTLRSPCHDASRTTIRISPAAMNPVNCVNVAACHVPISALMEAFATPCSVINAPASIAYTIPLIILPTPIAYLHL
ncbi:hypothetical protein D3C77_493350 [compost metagenome]